MEKRKCSGKMKGWGIAPLWTQYLFPLGISSVIMEGAPGTLARVTVSQE
jgi:hypothetical protein